MRQCVIGPVVGGIGGYVICALLQQISDDPITFARVGYCVFDALGEFKQTFAHLGDAQEFINDLMEADVASTLRV